MQFPRRERCSSFGNDVRCFNEDNEEMSLSSKLNVVMVFGIDLGIAEI